jgi:hypothetical protein
MVDRFSLGSLIFVAIAALGCGTSSSETNDSGADASSAQDAVSFDVAPDVGTTMDAGSVADVGSTMDAGSVLDAGHGAEVATSDTGAWDSADGPSDAAQAMGADGATVTDASAVADDGGLSPLAGSCSLIMTMDEAQWSGVAGEVGDSCGHNNGTPVGAMLPTTVSGGHFGRAGSFHAGGCVKIADDPGLRSPTTLTMAAWVRPDGGTDGRPLGIFSKRVDDGVDGQYTMFLYARNNVYVDIGTARYHGNQSIPYNGGWHHVAAVFDGSAAGSSLKIYVDGVLDVSLDAGQSIPVITPAPDLYLGCLVLDNAQDPYAETFLGSIDEAAIWQRALSAADIQALYQLPGPL